MLGYEGNKKMYFLHQGAPSHSQVFTCLAPVQGKVGKINKKDFRWRRWGSSLPGLHTLDPPLSPNRHQRNLFEAHVWEGVKRFEN